VVDADRDARGFGCEVEDDDELFVLVAPTERHHVVGVNVAAGDDRSLRDVTAGDVVPYSVEVALGSERRVSLARTAISRS